MRRERSRRETEPTRERERKHKERWNKKDSLVSSMQQLMIFLPVGYTHIPVGIKVTYQWQLKTPSSAQIRDGIGVNSNYT